MSIDDISRAAAPRPLTDAFGTRIDPADLLAGLAACGLGQLRLLAEDDGIVLECDEPDPVHDATARALTWLRSQLSPLVPVSTRGRTGDGPEFIDQRTRPLPSVCLAEVSGGPNEIGPALDDLLERLGRGGGGGAGGLAAPATNEASRDDVGRRIAQELTERLSTHGWSVGEATLSTLVQSRQGLQFVGAQGGAASPPSGPHFLFWFRPGTPRGVRAAVLIAGASSPAALRWLADALCDSQTPLPDSSDLLLDGLAWRASRRPTVVAPELNGGQRIAVDFSRCDECGVCAEMCPEDYLRADGRPATDDVAACTRCYECVDACPTDAIRPTRAADGATLASALAHRPGWLSRLAGLPGPSFPGLFPPSYLLPPRRDRAAVAPSSDAADGQACQSPRYVLGLAIMTMQEHAAALLRDGVLVGAIEHEKLVRLRHAGWHPVGRPGVTAAVDPTIALEEAFCRRPIRALLEQEGITLDDIEVIAVNGLHGRFAGQISFVDDSVPLPVIRAGRVVYFPHHLCHAASAVRMAGIGDAWVFTVDGRGDRECASLWRANGRRIEPLDTLLSLTDRSIGGVYEGVTRLLGFGSHGQGSVMALAAFGTPRFDLSEFMSITDGGEVRIHESGLSERFAHLVRIPEQPLTQEHRDLAASLQMALEEAALALIRRRAGSAPLDALTLGGGVALNCRMNERLRRVLRPRSIFVQPGANDAGTALGAALEAWAELDARPVAPMRHAYLGPQFNDLEIEAVLRRYGLVYRRCDSIADAVAERLAGGEVVCWFQGALEFGPRALGARSILADPRRPELHARVNELKQREPWRPFGPSILAGHEGEWIDGAFDSRFMLFTVPVREERRAEIPAVVHVDGTTRPQVVHSDTSPTYHAMIAEFYRRTGVPMVLNTSFNRRGEPIVCTPSDAVESFLGLGAEALAIGSFLVGRQRVPMAAVPPDSDLQGLPRGRRLALRLTTRCDFDCGHCTLRDQHGRPDREFDHSVNALVEGRRAGCDELVILRGEALLRDDLPAMIGAARRMGYRYIQLQTNAARLSDPRWRDVVLDAGVDAFEVQLLAADEALHDELTSSTGALRSVALAVRALVMKGRRVLVTVPVLARNLRQLVNIVSLAHKLGVREIQFNFPRPVELPDRVITDPVPRLSVAAPWVRRAAAVAQKVGMAVSTEGLPFCHLPPELHSGPDSSEEWRRHRIDDLHLVHESVADVRATQRPDAVPCRDCAARAACPRTWALYLELYGSGELTPFDETSAAGRPVATQ